MNGSLHTTDGRCVLRFERRLAHPVEKVWRAVTEPARLADWFPAEVEMELAVGGRVRWRFPGQETGGPVGTVTACKPPRLLEYRLGPHVVGDLAFGEATLRFELHPDPRGCRLVFINTFDDRVAAASFATGWHVCLDALEQRLAEQPVTWTDRRAELHDAYVEAFGLAAGQLDEAEAGWVVRFERQMTQPMERVWAALTGGEASPPAAAAASVGAAAPLAATNPHVSAGTVTAAEPPRLLEYDWLLEDRPAGRVRWELSPGPGGARLVLAQTLPGELEDRRATVLAAWHTHLELLASHLRGQTIYPWPTERTEELRQRYADRWC